MLILGEKSYLLLEEREDRIWGEDTVLTSDDNLSSRGVTFESRNRFQEIVRSHYNEFDRIAMTLNYDQSLVQALLSSISYDRKLRGRRIGSPVVICDSRPLIGILRLVKSSEEIINLKEAGTRSSKVHKQLMQQHLIGKTERQISNIIEAGFLLEDMQWTSYETIVGSGDRTTLLHARATDRVVQNGDLLLIDAGGEWNGYCSDITRVLPAGKIFSDKQRQIYQVVLTAQKAAIAFIKPGASLQEIHDLTKDVLVEELARLNLPENQVRQNIDSLMPHPTSHWMGMDVHDPSPYVDDSGVAIRLAPGMCFTIEPGLYFRLKDPFGEYYGLGVRIEDDVIVTEFGSELLSTVPKEIEEVEQLRARET